MATIAAQLTDLESRLKTAEGERGAASTTIETNRQTLQQSEENLQKLTLQASALQDRVDATKRVASAAESAEALLTAARESSTAEVADAKEDVNAWSKLVEDALPETTLEKLPRAIKKVDDAIADKHTTASELDTEVSEAEAKLAKAQAEATGAEAAYANWQADLQALQRAIDQSRAAVAATKAEAKTALDAGDFEAAFLKLHDLDNAVKALEDVTDATRHKALLDQLPDLWAAVITTAQALGEATDEVADKRNKAQDAHAAHDHAVQDRADSIAAELEAPDDTPPTAPPPPLPPDSGDEEPDES